MNVTEATVTFLAGSMLGPLTVLAEAGGMEVGSLIQAGGSLASTGFAVWFGWYTTTKVIPDLVANFRAEVAAERQFFAGEVSLARVAHKEDLNDVAESIGRLAERLGK